MIERFEHQGLPAQQRGFLGLAADSLLRPRTMQPLALLLLILVASAIAALLDPPSTGGPVPPIFAAALALRAGAVCWLSAVILRRAVLADRPAWLPDGAFWLFLPLFTLSLALPLLLAAIPLGLPWLAVRLAADALAVLIVSPFAPWLVALVGERPIALRPRFGELRLWLPQRVGWGLLLLVPLGMAHIWLSSLPFIDGRWFWPAAIADALVYFLLLALRLGLDAAAYWRVAQR